MNIYIILGAALVLAVVFALLIDRKAYGDWLWDKRDD